MANWMPPVLQNLSAISKAAANARPRWEPRNRCAHPFSAAVFTKTLPLRSARRFVLASMLRPLLPEAFVFPLGAGLQLPLLFLWLLPFPGLPGPECRIAPLLLPLLPRRSLTLTFARFSPA